jgi:hypothetical protein
MMKKAVPACVCIAALFLLVSCGGKQNEVNTGKAATSDSPTVAPIIDTSKADAIDKQLAAYADIVNRYLADTSENKTDAVTADEKELGTISEALSELAADFNADQLTKYNETTARLTN